jgi:hypothetical protein
MACAAVQAPVEECDCPVTASAEEVAGWASEWRDFTARIEDLTQVQRAGLYSVILARHVATPSDLSRLQLAYLQVRMDSTMPSLDHAQSLLEPLHPGSELASLADALRREIALLAALAAEHERYEQQRARTAARRKEVLQLKKQLTSVYEQLDKSLKQLETLKYIESDMAPDGQDGEMP